MAFSESGLQKLLKEKIISLDLEYQSKLDTLLAGIKNELSDLKKDFKHIKSELLITNLVNTKFK